MVKEIKFNAVDQCNPSFSAFGLWTHPRDQAIHYTGPEDWMDYAPARYESPYTFARGISTLDPMTKGRLGWNIVMSYLFHV